MLHEKLKIVGAFEIARTEHPLNQIGSATLQETIFEGSGYTYQDLSAEPFYASGGIGQDVYVDATNGDDDTGDGTSGNPFETLRAGIIALDDRSGGDEYGVIHLAGSDTYELDHIDPAIPGTSYSNMLEAINVGEFTGNGVIFAGEAGAAPTIRLRDYSNSDYPYNAAIQGSVLKIIPKEDLTWATTDIIVGSQDVTAGGLFAMSANGIFAHPNDLVPIVTASTYVSNVTVANNQVWLLGGGYLRQYTGIGDMVTHTVVDDALLGNGFFGYLSGVSTPHNLCNYYDCPTTIRIPANTSGFDPYIQWVDSTGVSYYHYPTYTPWADQNMFGSYVSACVKAIGATLYYMTKNGIVACTKKLENEVVNYTTWEAVDCATTANITIATDLNGGDVIDGWELVAGNRVLVKNQTDPTQNGIYIAGVTPVRASDADTAAEINYHRVYCRYGTVNAYKKFQTTSNAIQYVDYHAITFAEYSIQNSLLNETLFQEIPGLVIFDIRESTGAMYALTRNGEVWYSPNPNGNVQLTKIVQLDLTTDWRNLQVRDDGIWTFNFPANPTNACLTNRASAQYGAYRDGVLMEKGQIIQVEVSGAFYHYLMMSGYAVRYLLNAPRGVITSISKNLYFYGINVDGQNKHVAMISDVTGGRYVSLHRTLGATWSYGTPYTGDIWMNKWSNSYVGPSIIEAFRIRPIGDATETEAQFEEVIIDDTPVGVIYTEDEGGTIQRIKNCVINNATIGVQGDNNTVSVTGTIFNECGTDVVAAALLGTNSVIRRYSTENAVLFQGVYTGNPGFLAPDEIDFRLRSKAGGFSYDSPYIKDGSLEMPYDVGAYQMERTEVIGNPEFDAVIPIMWDELAIKEVPAMSKSTITPTGEYVEWSPNIGTTKRTLEFGWNDTTSSADSDVRRDFNHLFRDLFNYRDQIFQLGFDNGAGGFKPIVSLTNIQHDVTVDGLWVFLTTDNQIYKNELRGLCIYIPSLDDYMLILSNTTSVGGTFRAELYNNRDLDLTGVNDPNPHCDYWHVVFGLESGQTNKAWKFFHNDTNHPLPVTGYKLIAHESWRDTNE